MLTFTARTLPVNNGIERAMLGEMTLSAEDAKKEDQRQSIFDRLLRAIPVNTNNLALIAEEDVGWVGWALLWWKPGDGCNLGVYVRPAWRRLYIAKLLVLKQVEIAKHLGLTPYANTGDEGAQKLFRACGVRPFTPEYER